MQIVIEIPDVPIQDYQDLYHKIYGMAASEGLFDDKIKTQRALALKAVLDVLIGVVNGIVIPSEHGDLIDRDKILPYMRDRFDMQDLYLPIHFKDCVIDEMPVIVPRVEEDEDE